MGKHDKLTFIEKYELLKERYSLPEFKLINHEIELSNLDSKHFMLRQIRKRIYHRIDDFLEMLEDLLQPSADIAQMHECSFFSEKYKEKIYDTYRKLMFLSREAISLHILNNNRKDAAYIKKFFEELPELKKELYKISLRLKNSWNRDLDKKIKLEYFG